MADEVEPPRLSVKELSKKLESQLPEIRPPIPIHRPKDCPPRSKPPIALKPANLAKIGRVLPSNESFLNRKNNGETIEFSRNDAPTTSLIPCYTGQSSSNGHLDNDQTLAHSSRTSSHISIGELSEISTEVSPYPVAQSDSDSENDEFEANARKREQRGRAYRINSSAVPERRSFFYTDSMVSISSIHEKIMDELGKNNIVRASRRNNASCNEHRVIKRPPSLLSDGSSTINSETSPQTPRSSLASAESAPVENDPIPYYDTENQEENIRLRKLHFAAYEFLTVEEKFVKYLEDMYQIYPNYLLAFGERSGRNYISTTLANPSNPVERVKVLLSQIHPFHQAMLTGFQETMSNWDSRTPKMAALVKSYAHYLKSCKQFLMEKGRLLVELTELLQQQDFHNATMAFEEKIFRRGPGAVTHQLDQVHQNFLRYKNLMISYKNYLPPNSEELAIAAETIDVLEKVAQDVNKDMQIPSIDELTKLFDRFQGLFNVFKPGCRLIRHGEVLKQARKEPQPRILLLFSDVLWICRETNAGGVFDMDRSYDIPIDTVKTEVIEHDDFKTRLWIKSTKKSFQVLFKNVSERDQWKLDIHRAVEERREAVNRIYEARRRVSTAKGENDDRGSDLLSAMTCSNDAPVNGFLTTNLREADVQAAWIPDDASTHCLMQGCRTEFSLFNRRHHCRDCGWLICSRCSGHAPLAKQQFKSKNVCPECFDRIYHQYERGTLFPEAMLIRNANNPDIVTGIALNGKEVTMKELFTPPENRRLKRLDISARTQEKDGIVFGRVFQRAANGKETVKFAQLKDDLELSFFTANFDERPESTFVIHGYYLEEHEADDGNGALFEISHRNQFRSDRHEHSIKFRVDREDSRKKWSNALNRALTKTKE